MDARVPAVVAVVVTTGASPWLEETLSSLAAQSYEELSVLVLVSGDESDPTRRVGRILPDAFVRLLPGRPGYAAASNEALGMVEGATFFLLCHDDCALDRDVVHDLVEESFRSNAGVVSPKFVNWDDPSILLHVGMHCDKTGAVVDRIQDGEVDHGQHDAVRDVFVAPGGCVLIRADLWRELEGFDAGIVAMGEDLDLSWRSQVAGSRVVVAPAARVRHREAVASGLMPLTAAGAEVDGRRVTLQALQRRHELRTVLKCYTWFHLIRVLPQAAVLAMGECVVAVLARDPQRAKAVAGAWLWNARHLGELRPPRRQVAAHRLFPDAEVRRLQLHGSARLSRYVSRLSHQGFAAANAVVSSRAVPLLHHEKPERPELTGSVGAAFSEDADFDDLDDLDDLGHRSGRDRLGDRGRRSFLSTGRQRSVAVVVAALVVAIGTRGLFFGSLPMVGQLAPLLGWSSGWLHFFSGWQPSGVGTTAPASPAFGIVALGGTVLLGSMGLVQKVLLLGCLPLGALGLSRFMRPLVSPRARVVATICYLGLPLPYAALGMGRWDGLVAYAALPFIVARLARAAGMAPFDQVVGSGWRSGRSGQIAVLGAIIAAGSSFAPALLPMTLMCAVAMALGSVLMGQREDVGRVLGAAGVACGVAVVLCAPWVVGTLLAGRHAVEIFGLPISPATAPGWGEVTRFAVGPTVRSPLVWLLVAAAALPLLLGRGVRLAWATRLWSMACLSWVLAYASTHGWTDSFTPSETVVLAPAAIAIACGVGLGISSFENDLAGLAFGWRQVVSGLALVAAALGLLPVVAGAINGRWGLPSSGVEQPLAFLDRTATAGTSRTLWLGDPRALPVGGWSVEPGLSYALTGQGLPDSADVWTPAGPGPAEMASRAIGLAIDGGTIHLGQLLAALGVKYIVVVDGLDPTAILAGTVQAPPPAGLDEALLDQSDLQVVPGEFGVQVFKNEEVIPTSAQRSTPLMPTATTSWPSSEEIAGWRPVLGGLASGHGASGVLASGTVYAGYAPAGSLQLTQHGRTLERQPAFGWAAQFPTASAGTATMAVRRAPYVPLSVTLEVIVWLALAAAVLGWARPLGRRRAERTEP
ncbi:MAG: glycosyltransferase [Acidimicrobiales bacterium]